MSRKTDTQRRSEHRQAGVLVRMSRAERDALHAAAKERGIPVSDLLLESLAPYLDREPVSA